MYCLGIIDDNKQQFNKVCRFFDGHFELAEIPLLDEPEEIVAFIIENHIDAIAIDYKLQEENPEIPYNGDELFHVVTETMHTYPAFILTNYPDDAEKRRIDQFRIIDKGCMKSDSKDGATLIKRVKNQISNYHAELKEKEEELVKLLKRQQKGKLSINEIDRISELDDFLEKSLYDMKKMPKRLKSPDALEEIRKLNDLAEKTLKEIRKKDAQTKRKRS